MNLCRACSAKLPAGARFCPECGAQVEAAVDEMLKLVTIMFADVVSSTARAERMHPEDVRALMAEYFRAMSEEIRAEGGTLEKFVGDAIMAVFGVPTAHEDDPLRAVRAARRMLERLDRWNAERPPEERIDLRIGINSGDVIAAGAPGQDLLVTGDAVNVAARLQQLADPGTIVIGGRTARAVRGAFETRPLEPLAVKGKSEAVEAYVVGEEGPGEPRGVPGLAAPLVGRDAELDLLRTMFARAQTERRPQLVTIIGDAGVGKSRLVREFVGSLEKDAKLMVGRCLPYGEGVTLWPLGEILKADAVVLDTDSSEAGLAKIAELVRATIPPEALTDVDRTIAALASTIGLRPPGDPLEGLDPREAYRELVSAWRALLGSIAAQTPVVAVIEDIHWADDTMLQVLDELAERVEGPLLFVCPTRPDLLRARPEWGGGRRNFGFVPVDPLSSENSALLVSYLLDVDELPGSLRERILERSEGNPFFLEEIVRQLIDEGLLVQSNGRWRAHGELADVEIPDTVQAVILARLDLLAPEERRVAQEAAVVGRVFWSGAVARLTDVDDVEETLRTLSRRELVLERLSSSIAGQAEYIFKHVLIRDVAYESLPRRERARAHADVAAWIEQTSGERVEELAELLAHHYDSAFSLAGDDEARSAARRYYLVAAESAVRRLAIRQAQRFGGRAVELSEGPAELVAGLEALGDVYFVTFQGDGAYESYSEALAAIRPEQLADRARLAAKAATLPARWRGALHRPPSAERLQELIVDGLEAAGTGDSRDRALLLALNAFTELQFGIRSEENARALEEALAIAERLGDLDVLSAVLDGLSAWHVAAGEYADAWRATERRISFVDRLRDAREIGDVFAMASWESFHRGLFPDAVDYASACVERTRTIDPGSHLHGLAWRVRAQFAVGEWQRALTDQAELEALQEEEERELPVAFTLAAYATAGLCHQLRGERAAAERYVALLQRYRESRIGEDTATVGLQHGPPNARLCVHAGRADTAAELAPFPGEPHAASGLALEALTEVAAAQQDWAEARRVVDRARVEAAHGGLLALPFFADRLEGRMLAATSQLGRGAALLRRSADGFAELGAVWEEAWSRLLAAEALLAADRAGDARAEAAAALPVFERLRSVSELARAREILDRVAV